MNETILVVGPDDDGGSGDGNFTINSTFGNYLLNTSRENNFYIPVETFPFEFLLNGLGITICAILGIIGNGLSGIVLSRPQMRSSVTCLLLGLAFCDSLLIFISVLIFGLPSISDFTGALKHYRFVYYPLWVPYLFPISISAQTASVYITLAVTIERYVAVCHPLHARSLCTWKRARYCVFLVIFFAIVYNLSRWFEIDVVQGFDLYYNMTVYENTMSVMRADPLYIKIYINWSYLVVMYLVPFSGLVVFNLAIYRQVRKANRERQVLSKLQKREMGLATMLLCVVTVFLLCNVLPLVNNILESFYQTTIGHLVQASNFLVVFNSSVNFVIYCTCGERFRRLLLRICRDFLWCRIGGGKNGSGRRGNNSSFFRKSRRHGGDFEEMSLASIANPNTCISTANGNGHHGHGTLILDIQKRQNNFRNKTIPMAHAPNNNLQNPQNQNQQQQQNGSNGKLYINRRISSPASQNH